MQHDCNIEKEIEKDKKSVSKDTLEKNPMSKTSFDEITHEQLAKELKEKSEDLKVQQIVNEFNRVCTKLPKALKLSPRRKSKVKARLKVFSKEEIYKAFEMASCSNFLNGSNNNGWKATFDWFFENDNNIQKVLEGNYNNKASPKNLNGMNNFSQRDYDFDDLEKKLIHRSG